MKLEKTNWLRMGILLAMTALTAKAAVAVEPVRFDAKGKQWAEKTLHQMSVEEKVGQMIMVWAKVRFLNDDSPQLRELHEDMQRYHIGGFGITIPVEDGQLAKSEPLETAALTNRLQKESKYPLLFAADFERGLSMRLNGATSFPAAMAFGAAGDPDLVRQFGKITAEESRAIGIHWNWFPIADVNSNPDNPIIDTRAFGEDPVDVSKMVAAYIEGAHQGGQLTTAKHFPGHGDTDTDSHLALARVKGDRARLDAVELVPFRAAFAAGVDSVMVGHLIVPSIEPDPNRPASISAKVIGGVLQKELGFKGLVVTDALDMNGLKHVFKGSEFEIAAAEAVAAVQAGNDMVIIPGDVAGAYTGLLRAVKSGKIPQKRIDASVLKILRMKAAVGLEHHRLVDLNAAQKVIASQANFAIARQTAERAITAIRDEPKLLPLATTRPGTATTAVIFTDRVGDSIRALASELRKHAPGASVFYIDPATAAYQRNDVLEAVKKAGTVIAIAEAVPNPQRTTKGHADGSAAVDSDSLELLKAVVAAAPQKTVVAALGNPYTGSSLPGMKTYVCTFSGTPLSAVSLVRALYGEIPIQGHSPVSIPGVAARGAGMTLAATK